MACRPKRSATHRRDGIVGREIAVANIPRPVPESIKPPLRLIPDGPMSPHHALIVPWQSTGSLIVVEPVKPFPAGTTQRCSQCVGQAKRAIGGDSGGQVKSGGNDEKRIIAHRERGGLKVLPRAGAEIDKATRSFYRGVRLVAAVECPGVDEVIADLKSSARHGAIVRCLRWRFRWSHLSRRFG